MRVSVKYKLRYLYFVIKKSVKILLRQAKYEMASNIFIKA
jgi:hypothetical protein